MTFLDRVRAQFKPSPRAHISQGGSIDEKDSGSVESQHGNINLAMHVADGNTASGVARMEAAQAVWGKNGKYLLWTGLALMMIVFELDNTTVGSYHTWATSDFEQLSLLAAINTSSTIISAVIKPPIAKISDVIGRGETYIFTISCYFISYIMSATSKNVNVYAGGAVFYAIGQAGTQILDQIIVSDISTARWRGFAVGFSYFPFLITPWVSAFIVESVLNGIGWRWGTAMFAIIMPVCASFIIITLMYYQRKAKKAGVVLARKTTIYDFCSLIDLGGIILLSGGFAMLLLPITLAARTPSRWQTPWLGGVIGTGAVFLGALIPYEKSMARHPIIPVRYFKDVTIVMCVLLSVFDSMGFASTHIYLYAWSIIARGFSVRNATFLAYTNGIVQCLVAILAGWVMWQTRKYKYLGAVGCAIRLVGYGVMIRLRRQDTSIAELFIVQCVQGVGSGILASVTLVAPQIVVTHAELAQVSAWVLLTSFLGAAIGQAVAGGIFTNTLADRLRKHLPEADESTINTLYNSITSRKVPDWGTPDRVGVNQSYSDVVGYISVAALALSVPMMILVWFLPNLTLSKKGMNNVEGLDQRGQRVDEEEEVEVVNAEPDKKEKS